MPWYYRWLDLLERAAWSFVQAFAAAVVVQPNGLNLLSLKIAAGAALLSVLKTISLNTTENGRAAVIDSLKTLTRRKA